MKKTYIGIEESNFKMFSEKIEEKAKEGYIVLRESIIAYKEFQTTIFCCLMYKNVS